MTADLHHLAAAYALDALDADERQAFEAHYPTCEICSSEVTEFRAVAGELAQTTAVAPPPALRANVLAQISETRQLPPALTPRATASRTDARRQLPARPLLAAAAALLLIAGVAAVALRPANDQQIDELVSAPDRVVTPLQPTIETDTSLQVIWSAERDEVVLIGSGLETLSAQQAYALWFIFDDGSVAPATLFRSDDGAVTQLLSVDDRDPSGWGISVEPASGSEQPTTPVLFTGTL